MMGARLILGKEVGWRRWSAVIFGFCRVPFIIRLGMSSFEQASILALLGVTFLACRDLVTRVIPSGLSAFIVTTYVFGASNIASIMLIPFYATLISPTPQQWLWFFANNVGRSVVCRYRGCDTRQGVAVNAPWRNSCLVFSLLIAVVFLG